MSEFVSEVERRRRALELAAGGMTDREAAAAVGRSRQWLHKWRVRQAGDGSIVERSRTPSRQPTKTSDEVTAAVLAVRDQLEQDPVASIGAISILATMERAGFEPLPSERTIERILTTMGRSHPRPSKRTGPKRRLPLPDVAGLPGIWQQSDWIHDRYLRGGIVFNSLQTADVGSAGIAAGQYVRRTVRNAVTFLLEQAWPVLSIPQAMSVDNAFVKTSHPNNPWTAWTLMCLFFGVEVIVSPPGGLGWTNHIEAVNNLWQQRTIRRHLFVSLDEVRAGSDQACRWFNHQRPIHDPAIHGTRYPGRTDRRPHRKASLATHHHHHRPPRPARPARYPPHHRPSHLPTTRREQHHRHHQQPLDSPQPHQRRPRHRHHHHQRQHPHHQPPRPNHHPTPLPHQPTNPRPLLPTRTKQPPPPPVNDVLAV